VESRLESRCKKKLPACWGGRPFVYNMWQIGLSPSTTRLWSAPLGRTARADSERYSMALRTADDEYHCLSPMPFAGYAANDAVANITVALVMSWPASIRTRGTASNCCSFTPRHAGGARRRACHGRRRNHDQRLP
jgi:hypothetical protein